MPNGQHSTGEIRNLHEIEASFGNNNRYVTVQIGDEIQKALPDTGATVSLLSLELHQRLLPHLPLEKGVQFVMKTVSGKEMSYEGTVVLEFKIGESTFKHRFIVTNDSKHDIILGRDFFKLHAGIINVGKDYIQVTSKQKEVVRVPMYNCEEILKQRKVCVVKHTSIPPMSEMFMFCNVTCEDSVQLDGITGFTEQNTTLAKKKCLTTVSSVAKVINNMIPVCVLNPTPHHVTLYPNQTVCYFKPETTICG